jgi:16S rRNA (cytosine1402-N4)-methyltransferase
MSHVPVLLNEVIEILDPQPGKRFIDATYGMGGHAKEIVKRGGVVLGIDQDPSVILEADRPIGSQDSSSPKADQNDRNLLFVQGNFADIKQIAEANSFTNVDGILFDPGRGFSFQKTGPLDMRYNPLGKIQISKSKFRTAEDIVNQYSEKELISIFLRYGEEKRSGRRIARAILEKRKRGSLKTTTELFELIKTAMPAKFRHKAGDTARRIFQALRIEVNDELGNLKRGLEQSRDLLKKGGRIAVISFHSLEDRMVKRFFVENSQACICPKEFPVCRCGGSNAKFKILTKKPITASETEIKTNSRSKSAKLRAAERI